MSGELRNYSLSFLSEEFCHSALWIYNPAIKIEELEKLGKGGVPPPTPFCGLWESNWKKRNRVSYCISWKMRVLRLSKIALDFWHWSLRTGVSNCWPMGWISPTEPWLCRHLAVGALPVPWCLGLQRRCAAVSCLCLWWWGTSDCARLQLGRLASGGIGLLSRCLAAGWQEEAVLVFRS